MMGTEQREMALAKLALRAEFQDGAESESARKTITANDNLRKKVA